MLTKPERNQKKDIFRHLFEPRTNDEKKQNRLATSDEVKAFLDLSGRDHRKYFHYTDLKAFLGMLESGQLWLTRADMLNDLKEIGTQSARKMTYIVSFGPSALENVAMWWMYGLKGKESDQIDQIPVRLEFGGKSIQSLVTRLDPNDPNMDADRVQPLSVPNGEVINSIQSASLYDMLYQRTKSRNSEKSRKRLHGAVSWNGLIANETRCSAFRNAREELPGFVKDVGWAYENETRLTIRLSSRGALPEKIAIPFVEALKTVRVIVGPGRNAESNFKATLKRVSSAPKIEELASVSDWTERIQPSFYQINFTR